MQHINTTQPQLAQVRIEADALRGMVVADAVGYLVRRLRRLVA